MEAVRVVLAAPSKGYVGVDRRAGAVTAAAAQLSRDRVLVTMFGLLLSLWVLLEVVSGSGVTLPFDTEGLARLLNTAVVALGAVAALLAFVRWRLTGEARPLWVGAAALAFGPLAVGAGDLVPAVVTGHSNPGVLQLAGQALAAVALGVAALWHQVDTRLRPRYVMGGVPAAAVLLAVVLSAASTIATAGGSRIAFAVLWAAVSALHIRAARTTDTASHETIALVAATLALAELLIPTVSPVPGAAGVGSDPWVQFAGAALLSAVAFVILVGRGLRDLEAAFVTQRARLLETEIGMEAEAARRRAEQLAHEERAHDARNSLLAIEGAAVALERYRDRLEPERRAQLVEAVSGEISRLQHLITAEGRGTCEPFDVAELLGPVLEAERARGLLVDVQLGNELMAVGRSAETVEVVRNLLDNARNYAPGSPVTVRGAVDGEWAVVYVEDRGRGVGREERKSVFERGRRGAAASGTEGSGLGLFVSRRLMLDQGGDLWVENREGGGASFGLCLPLADAPSKQLPVRRTA